MPRLLPAAFALVALVAPAIADNASSPSIASFLKIRTPSSVSIAADGAVYLRDWPDGVNQLYRRTNADDPKAPTERITDFKDGLSGYSLSPDGKTIILSAAVGGNENTNLWRLDVSTSKITPILQNPEVQYAISAWLRDSSGFIYRANDDSPNDFHLYTFDLASGASKKILAKPGFWGCDDVTSDGKRAIVSQYRSVSDSRVHELDLTTGATRDISATPEGTESANTVVGYLPGEKSVLLATDVNEGLTRLYVRDLTPAGDLVGTPLKDALPDLAKFELDSASINPERTYLATNHNEDGYATLRIFAVPDMKPVALPEIEKGVVSTGFFRGPRLIYTVNNARTPGIDYLYNLETKAAPKPVTARMDNEPIDLNSFLLPTLVKYTSFDGLEVPAFLYLPKTYKKGTPIPFVIIFHGGPEGQSRPTFSAATQHLVANGYGVMLPNVRGSTGYGREYHRLDNYKNRWNSVKDGAEAARWLVKQGYALPKKISAYGGSYGGYMANATIIEGADVFGASVNIVGIVNMRTFLEQTKGYRRKLREVEYGPLTDSEFLDSVSPINRLDEIKVPMLIAHGLNDPRVPVGEAMQLAVGLQKRGYDPELVFFPDEGHGFAKLDNRIVFYERVVRFLDRAIGPKSQ